MGKQSRHERRDREGPDALRAVPLRSPTVLMRRSSACSNGIAALGAARGVAVRRVEIDRFAGLLSHFLDKGFRWSPWCYLPLVFVGAGLGESLAIDTNPALVSPATVLAAVAGAWAPGRIAVRFDDDLADALMVTPLESTIPPTPSSGCRRGVCTSTARWAAQAPSCRWTPVGWTPPARSVATSTSCSSWRSRTAPTEARVMP